MAPYVPQARVVRKGRVAFAPPSVPWRERAANVEAALGPRARGFAAAVVGLWPVTAVVVMSVGLMWLAMLQGSP